MQKGCSTGTVSQQSFKITIDIKGARKSMKLQHTLTPMKSASFWHYILKNNSLACINCCLWQSLNFLYSSIIFLAFSQKVFASISFSSTVLTLAIHFHLGTERLRKSFHLEVCSHLVPLFPLNTFFSHWLAFSLKYYTHCLSGNGCSLSYILALLGLWVLFL